MNKRKVTLSERQYEWLCSKLQQEYSSALDIVNDMTSPSSVLFFKRNDADDVRRRRLRDACDMISFCKSFSDSLVHVKGGES